MKILFLVTSTKFQANIIPLQFNKDVKKVLLAEAKQKSQVLYQHLHRAKWFLSLCEYSLAKLFLGIISAQTAKKQPLVPFNKVKTKH